MFSDATVCYAIKADSVVFGLIKKTILADFNRFISPRAKRKHMWPNIWPNNSVSTGITYISLTDFWSYPLFDINLNSYSNLFIHLFLYVEVLLIIDLSKRLRRTFLRINIFIFFEIKKKK